MIHYNAIIHPKAHVDRESCQVGAGTRIWQFASVTRGTILGEDCSVSPGAMLDGPHFGDRCVISGNVSMGAGFKIGNDVFIGPNVVFCNDAWPMANKEGFDHEALQKGAYTIIVGDGSSIGAGAIIMPGVYIGSGAMVAAGSIVTKPVPEGCLWRDGNWGLIDTTFSKRDRSRMRIIA